jgi:hypothetical protein
LRNHQKIGVTHRSAADTFHMKTLQYQHATLSDRFGHHPHPAGRCIDQDRCDLIGRQVVHQFELDRETIPHRRMNMLGA